MGNPAKDSKDKLLRVGELAKRVGKSVRAVHLYEEMGLLTPTERSAGGFRLFDESAVDRIRWILNLQAIGFSLTEVQEFVREFEQAGSGAAATDRVREIFQGKLDEVKAQLVKLHSIERDLVDSLNYLESCRTCEPSLTPYECHNCDHHGHEMGEAPPLFAGLSNAALDNHQAVDSYDVAASKLSGRSPHQESN